MSQGYMEQQRKLRVLCLHGYRQDAKMFKSKLGAFEKGVKKLAELVFIDAPHVIPNQDTCDSQRPGRSWWFTTKDYNFHSSAPTDLADGMLESIEKIKNFMESEGPFDGLLGFSQGAAFAVLLCSLKQYCGLAVDFKFIVMIAGFRSPSKPHQHLYEKLINLPSLHIIGEGDKVISKSESEELMKSFHNPTCIYHEGGHFLPTKADVMKKYKEFLQRMQVIN